jgi:hypothetical protein
MMSAMAFIGRKHTYSSISVVVIEKNLNDGDAAFKQLYCDNMTLTIVEEQYLEGKEKRECQFYN